MSYDDDSRRAEAIRINYETRISYGPDRIHTYDTKCGSSATESISGSKSQTQTIDTSPKTTVPSDQEELRQQLQAAKEAYHDDDDPGWRNYWGREVLKLEKKLYQGGSND